MMNNHLFYLYYGVNLQFYVIMLSGDNQGDDINE